jgi:hypothetical protein
MGAGRTQNGLGMKSRLPVDNPGVWLRSGGDGRLNVFRAGSVKVPALIISEEVITEEPAGERGHHVYGYHPTAF